MRTLLSGLAEKLRKRKVDPRDVVIEPVPPAPAVVRTGLRRTPDAGQGPR